MYTMAMKQKITIKAGGCDSWYHISELSIISMVLCSDISDPLVYLSALAQHVDHSLPKSIQI